MKASQGNKRKKMNTSHSSGQQTPCRTKLQTIALVYVVLHGFIFWGIARSMSAEDTTLALVLFGFSSLASVIAGVAMWFWRRWGLHLYVVATLVLGGVVLLKTASMTMAFGVALPMFIVIYIFSSVLKHFK